MEFGQSRSLSFSREILLTSCLQDDGSEVISCDQCEDWQHLECHHRADLDSGRPNVDYSTVDFICAKCQTDPSRAKQRRDVPTPVVYSPVKEKKAYKPREKKAPVRRRPLSLLAVY